MYYTKNHGCNIFAANYGKNRSACRPAQHAPFLLMRFEIFEQNTAWFLDWFAFRAKMPVKSLVLKANTSDPPVGMAIFNHFIVVWSEEPRVTLHNIMNWTLTWGFITPHAWCVWSFTGPLTCWCNLNGSWAHTKMFYLWYRWHLDSKLG